MITLNNLENLLQQTIFPDLERGREGFDLEHTKTVVYWVKKICDSEPGMDRKVLVTAAYAHDWGYADLFGKSPSLDEVMSMKKKHMEVGAEKIERLLRSMQGEILSPRQKSGLQNDNREVIDSTLKFMEGGSLFSEEQILRVAHLVRVHDRLDLVEADDEIALVEADTLGALYVDRVKPTFNPEDNARYIVQVKKTRRPLFRHKRAIEAYEELVKKREEFYAK